MAVYGYLSAPAQHAGQRNDSAETQLKKIAGHVFRRGWILNQVFMEWNRACHDPLEDRPQGKNLLAALGRGDVVIACRADHMFRCAEEALPVLIDFRKRGIALVFLDMGWEITRGDLADRIFAILAAVARIGRVRVQRRGAAKPALRRRSGEYLGGAAAPFGFTTAPSGAWAPVEKEQAILQDIVVLRECGFSFERISRILKGKGFFLSPQAVQRLAQDNRDICILAS